MAICSQAEQRLDVIAYPKCILPAVQILGPGELQPLKVSQGTKTWAL